MTVTAQTTKVYVKICADWGSYPALSIMRRVTLGDIGTLWFYYGYLWRFRFAFWCKYTWGRTTSAKAITS